MPSAAIRISGKDVKDVALLIAVNSIPPELPLADIQEGWVVALVVAAALLGFGVVKLLDYLRKRDADKEAAQIIERAEIEAAARRKEAAVEAREMALQEKARLEKENEAVRRELHERERKLDKADDANQSRADQLAKQEKMVESNQRRLAEKMEDAVRRQKELDDLLDLERQTMHQLSGLSREEAESRLLGRLEKELVREQGAMILRYEREAVEKTQVKAKEMLITAVQRFAAAHTAESTTSTVD